MADTVEQYRAELVTQAEEAMVKLLGKVAKTEDQLADAKVALALAEAELQRVRTADLDFVRPTEHVRAQA